MKTTTDPMLAAIEANRAAVEMMGLEELDEQFDRLGEIGRETWERMSYTNPTTVADLLAFMAYARERGLEGCYRNLMEDPTLEAWQAVERMIGALEGIARAA
jgi:hypothetical protein